MQIDSAQLFIVFLLVWMHLYQNVVENNTNETKKIIHLFIGEICIFLIRKLTSYFFGEKTLCNRKNMLWFRIEMKKRKINTKNVNQFFLFLMI